MNLMATRVNGITELSAREILNRIGSIALISDIGTTSTEIGNFYEVSERTLQRIYQDNKLEFLKYGDYRQNKEVFKTLKDDKFVGIKIRRLNLFNRKHILLFACHLGQTSEVAKVVIRYLIESESLLRKEGRIEAMIRITENLIASEVIDIDILRLRLKEIELELAKLQPRLEFAETLEKSDSLISIGDFAKVTYNTLGFGRNNLFKLLKEEQVLQLDNRPYQTYIDN